MLLIWSSKQPKGVMKQMPEKIGKPRKKYCEFAITIDTREQTPWLFRDLRTRTWDFIVSAAKDTLQQGDYAITGLESQLVIERKSLEDLFGTLSEGRDRFTRELERITDCCRQGVVIVEAPWSVISAPEHFRSNWRSRLRPQSVIGSIQSAMVKFPKVHWMCLPSRREAEWSAFQLMRFTFERHQKRWSQQFDAESETE